MNTVAAFGGSPYEGPWPLAPVQYVAQVQAGDGITQDRIRDSGPVPVFGGNGLRGYTDRHNAEGARVLVGRQGALCGNVHLVRGRFWASEHALVVTPPLEEDARWLRYVLEAAKLGRLSVAAAQPGITRTAVETDIVPVAPSSDRSRIADYLDRETAEIDAMDAALDRLVETLRERRLAVVEKTLSPGFERGGGQPVWSLLGPTKDQGHSGEQVLSVYRDYGVIPKNSRDDNHNRTPADLSNYQLVQPGDVVINKMKAWQGSLGVSAHRGIVSPDYQVCRPLGSEVDSRYLHLVLRSPQMIPQYRVRSKGIRPSQWRLYWEDMATLVVPVPSLEEQRRIVVELDEQTAQIDNMIADAERLKGLLAERRSTLITAVVTGKKEVPT